MQETRPDPTFSTFFLRYDLTLAFFVRFIASISMLICLAFGAWLIMRMKLSKGKKSDVISG